jgi:SpoIID/LytB domain protein
VIHWPAALAFALCAFGTSSEDAGASLPEGADAGSPSAPLFSGLSDPNDPLERLYGRKQLSFEKGAPAITVMLMEGQPSVTFIPQGRMRLRARGGLEKVIEAPAGTVWAVRLKGYEPAEVSYSIEVAELAFADKEQLAQAKGLWEGRGFSTRTVVSGSLYGIAGQVLDNRHSSLLIGPPATEAEAKEILKELHAKYGFQATLSPSLKKRPHGLLEIKDGSGTVLAIAQDLASISSPDKQPFLIKDVEFGAGYAWHDRQDRAYRGDLELVVDRFGGIAVVNVLPLESYLRGIVASEIHAKAHPEALKAQAICARGQVLAKLGTRHLIDPYLLCAEQHCQVYSGMSKEAASTDAAIAATAGEALFAPRGGPLVDSVYSAVCGGHTEDNDAVWGGAPDPSLRGRPDLVDPASKPYSRGIRESNLKSFIDLQAGAYCSLSSFANAKKYRWERRFSQAEMNEILEPLSVGPVQAITVASRGTSGRATVITVSGEQGATQVRGELNIRRLLKNLNSALFELEPPAKEHPGQWLFRGAGWGHGVGMCQVGAIGRAERGQSYRQILRYYFNGAEVVPIY